MENHNQANDSVDIENDNQSISFQEFDFDRSESMRTNDSPLSSEYQNDFDVSRNTGNTTNSFRRILRSHTEASEEENTSSDVINHSNSARHVREYLQNSNASHQSSNDVDNSNVNRSSEMTDNSNGNNSLSNSNLYSNHEDQTSNSRIENDFFYENNIDDYEYDSDDEFYDCLEEAIDFDENDFRPTYTKLLELLEDHNSNETITANIVVSKTEVLLAILKFSFVYSLPNSAIADLCKMFNTFLDVSILPDTRYLIDKIFYPDEGIQYHAVCPNCSNYVKEFTKENVQVRCDICEQNINLKDPLYRDFFVVLNIENELQHLIESNQDYYMNVLNKAASDDFEDIHDGQKYKDFVSSLPEDRQKSYLSITFNSDGSPIFKRSKFSIWPIQIIPNEIPPSIRNKRPLTYALWFGRDKPDMNIFLAPFVKGINRLSNTGIDCTINNEVKNIKIYALCCCVDSVARAPMQGFSQYNGYYGCNWCLHPGELVTHKTGRAMKYTLLNYVPERRSERDTLQHMQDAINSVPAVTSVYGVKKATPLIKLNNFDIIDGFVPDAMHCIDLGVVKQFSDYWFSCPNKTYSISKRDIERIDKYVKSFKVPTQLARLSRSIMDRKYWKAREWENWLLYYSLPVLQEIEGFRQYSQHWALLVEAFYILQQSSITTNELLMTHRLLKKFVAETEFYYTNDAMSFNVHQLLHIPQSVADWGPLWAHSGYAFESGNGQIIRTVHAAKGVLSQVCRNLSIKESLIMVERHVFQREGSPVKNYCFYLQNRCTAKSLKLGINRYFGKARAPENGFMVNMNVQEVGRYKAYMKLIKSQCVFKSCTKVLQRSCNSFAQTIDGEYIQIIQFIVDTIDNTEYTLHKKLEVENSFDGVCNSIKKVIRIQDNCSVVETSEIDKLCIYMKIKQNQYISAVPNMHWYS